jgi:hypothetical protein
MLNLIPKNANLCNNTYMVNVTFEQARQWLNINNFNRPKLWTRQHQEDRCNLTHYHRGELALKFKEIIATKSKERQLSGLKQNSVPLKSAERKETRQELAEMAGVAATTLG